MLETLSHISADDMDSVMSDELMMNSMGPMIALVREKVGSVGETMNDQEDMSMNTTDEDIMRHFMAPSAEPTRALSHQGTPTSPACTGSVVDLIATMVSLFMCALNLTAAADAVGKATARSVAPALTGLVLEQVGEFAGVSLAVHVASSAIDKFTFASFIASINDNIYWYEWIWIGVAFFAEVVAFLVTGGASMAAKIVAKVAILISALATVIEFKENCGLPV